MTTAPCSNMSSSTSSFSSSQPRVQHRNAHAARQGRPQRLYEADSVLNHAADRPRASSATHSPTPQDAATLDDAQLSKCAWYPRAWDPKKMLLCYFALIFGCRLLLRSPCSQGLHWALVMFMEDGMSMMSFALGLLYLNSRNGAAMSLLTKCVARNNQAEPSNVDPQQPVDAAEALPTRQKPVRLFYFAM